MNLDNRQIDYRVNAKDNSNISVEIKCCGQYIGEVRFKNGEEKRCPHCGKRHALRIDHNHYHLSQYSPD